MKKIMFYLSIIILNLIFINPVFANTEEEELKRILDLIPNEYNLNIISSLEMTEIQTKYYLYSNISKIIYENEHELLFCSSTTCIFNSSDMELFIENTNEKYKLTLSDESSSISKELTLNLNYVEANLEDEQSINDAITYIRNKNNEFSDFDFSYINYEFITSPQIIDEASKKYEVSFMNCAYAGSDAFSTDEQLVVYFHYDYIYIFKNEVLYKIIKDDIIIDTTIYINQYFPTLDLNDYDDIEKYIDDVFIAFKERTGYANCIIKETDDGDRYKVTSTSDDGDSYIVNVINLDDNTEWNIYFSGKLKEKEETSEPLLGDMNGDGKITITDVILLLRKYLGLT